jgi:hypothetical protein
MKVTKRKQTWASLDSKKVYALDEAIETLRGFCSSKFDESLEIAIKLGIDVTKADQNIRGMLSLPNGTGKSVRVAVFTVNNTAKVRYSISSFIPYNVFPNFAFHNFLFFNQSYHLKSGRGDRITPYQAVAKPPYPLCKVTNNISY